MVVVVMMHWCLVVRHGSASIAGLPGDITQRVLADGLSLPVAGSVHGLEGLLPRGLDVRRRRHPEEQLARPLFAQP